MRGAGKGGGGGGRAPTVPSFFFPFIYDPGERGRHGPGEGKSSRVATRGCMSS